MQKLPSKPKQPKGLRYFPWSKPLAPTKPQESRTVPENSLVASQRDIPSNSDVTEIVREWLTEFPTYRIFVEVNDGYYPDDLSNITLMLYSMGEATELNAHYDEEMDGYKIAYAVYKEDLVKWKEYDTKYKAWEAECKRIKDLNQLEKLKEKYE